MRKHLLSILLVLALFIAAVPAAFAEDPMVAQVGDKQFPTLAEAVTAANESNGTITLLSDAELPATQTITGNVVLELGDHTITAVEPQEKSMFQVKGSLTVRGGENGAIVGGEKTTIALNVSAGGTLTVEGGTIQAKTGIQAIESTVSMTGGTIKGTTYGASTYYGTFSISGSAVIDGSSNGAAVQASGTAVTISENAQLTGGQGIKLHNSNKNNGYLGDNTEASQSASLTMTGGSILGDHVAINANNMNSAGVSAEITGGTISSGASGTAIYWPMEGTLTIGGTAKVSGGTAIEAKMGTITIQDQAVIEGTGEYNEDKPTDGGSSPEGSALLFSAQMYGASEGQYRTSPNLTVNITGGTLKSTSGNVVTVYNTEKTEAQTANITVTGGTLEPAEGKVAVRSYATSGNDVSVEEDGSLKTSKGTTTVTVSNEVTSAATDANGVTLYYNDLSDALSAADAATATAPVEVFAVASSDVSAKALSNTNVTLTVAKGVTLNVNNGDSSNTTTLKATTNADGSTSYSLEAKTQDTTVEKPTVTLTADKTSATEGDTITLTAAATSATQGVTYSYIWYKDDVQIPGAAGSTLAVTSAGKYTVGVRAMLTASGAVYQSNMTISDPVALNFTPRPAPSQPVDEHPEIGEAIANGTWGQPESAPAVTSSSSAAAAATPAPSAGSVSTGVPQTSDDANLTLWIVLLTVSAAAIVVLGTVMYRRRKSSK